MTDFSIKALGDWLLDVRGVPFGSPEQLDATGQYFTPNTNLRPDTIPAPMVLYYHSLTPDKNFKERP